VGEDEWGGCISGKEEEKQEFGWRNEGKRLGWERHGYVKGGKVARPDRFIVKRGWKKDPKEPQICPIQE